MKRTSSSNHRLLKTVVTRLCFFAASIPCCFIAHANTSSVNAQENFSRQKPTRSELVQPIQRKTVTYTKGVPKSATPSPPRIDWTTLPSTYTHAPDGQRVDQFAAVTPEPIFEIPANARSGYRHTRSTLQAGFSSDNYHSVEQWGAPIRPYGEWRYPNRPFAVPYGAWGPQLPQVVGGGLGFFPGPFAPHPHPPTSGPNPGPGFGSNHFGHAPFGYPPSGFNPFGVGPQNALSPFQDDYYPQAPMFQSPDDHSFRHDRRYHPLRNGLE